MTTAGNPFDLTGRRALVTGASQGIGVAIAARLAAAGVHLVLTGRDGAVLTSQAAELRGQYGVGVHVQPADLSDATDVERLAAAALQPLDGLDILVNNAGVSFPEPLTEVTVEHWDRTLAVNLRAPSLLSARIGAAMAAAGRGGSIVNIASAAGRIPLAEHYAYSTSKAGLIMATRMLALELGPAGIRANVICPTVVMTEMGQRVWGDAAKAAPLLARVPAGRFADPDDVTSAVLYLASDASAMVNGCELPVDGGYSAV